MPMMNGRTILSLFEWVESVAYIPDSNVIRARYYGSPSVTVADWRLHEANEW